MPQRDDRWSEQPGAPDDEPRGHVPARPIRVLIADDDALMRELLRYRLQSEPDLAVVGEVDDGEEAVRATCELAPDVLLLDLVLPGLDGVQVTRRLAMATVDARIVVLTGRHSVPQAQLLMHLGVRGYLSKGVASHELVSAIRAVHAGEVCIESSIARRLFGRDVPGAQAPTARELEVLELVAAGRQNRGIAERLCISHWTVQFHLKQLFGKLHASTRTELVDRARSQGWLRGGR